MHVYIATDHAGFELKEKLVSFLKELGHKVIDCGASVHDAEDDYPDFVKGVARAVSEDSERRGVILGGSGQGEAMVANRFLGVRAAVYYGGASEIITLAREHNDANILSLGARFVSEAEAKEVVRMFLETPFPGEERHKRRIAKIDEYDGAKD